MGIGLFIYPGGRIHATSYKLSHRANITWSVGSASPPRLMLGLVFNLFLRES
jgi:hypothetical protein